MKNFLLATDRFIIRFSTFINILFLLAATSAKDALAVIVFLQMLIGAYTIALSGPLNLLRDNPDRATYSKRIKHLIACIFYLLILFPLHFYSSNTFMFKTLLILVPQVLLFYYSSLYINYKSIFTFIKQNQNDKPNRNRHNK